MHTPLTRHTFTRDQIRAALDAADLDIPDEAFYADRIEFTTGTCLRYAPDGPADLLAFTHIIAGLIPEAERLDFLGSAQRRGAHGEDVTFPGYVLDEPTFEERQYMDNDDVLADAMAVSA